MGELAHPLSRADGWLCNPSLHAARTRSSNLQNFQLPSQQHHVVHVAYGNPCPQCLSTMLRLPPGPPALP